MFIVIVIFVQYQFKFFTKYDNFVNVYNQRFDNRDSNTFLKPEIHCFKIQYYSKPIWTTMNNFCSTQSLST